MMFPKGIGLTAAWPCRPERRLDMTEAWPALCTGVALVLLVVGIIRWNVNAFLALVLVSLGLGLASGLPPEQIVEDMKTGLGKILGSVAVVLALGAILGRLLDASGAAEAIARTMVQTFGERRASLAILVAAYLVGIPMMFNAAFLLLLPIMYRLQRDTGRSLLYFVMPLAFSLGVTHSLLPPHPGIVAAVGALGRRDPGTVMVQTILFGALLGIPMVLVGWLGPGRWWAARQHVEVPALAGLNAVANEDQTPRPLPPFVLAVLIVTLPLLLSLFGFGVQLLHRSGRLPAWLSLPLLESVEPTAPRQWLQFVGQPEIALLVATLLAMGCLSMRGRGISKLSAEALLEVGPMLFLFGAAGCFMQVIASTGAGKYLAAQVLTLPLSPVAVAFLVAMLTRMALGSATVSIMTSAGLLQSLADSLPGQEIQLVLAVACGTTFMTQPADSGFWMMKEYCNLSERDVMFRFNACRIPMALTGLGLLLAAEWLF